MKHLFLVTILSIILIGSIVYLVGTSPTTPSSAIIENQMNPTPFITAQSTPSSQDIELLKQGGSSYRDPDGLYTFLYPNDYRLDAQASPPHLRISKTGSTQRGQTEMYDGVIVVFESVDLKGQTLEQFVDARIRESTKDGTTQVTQPKKPATLTTYTGFTYTLSGLGETTYLVIQKDKASQHAISITSLVADPQKKDYQKEVDVILSTLELLK